MSKRKMEKLDCVDFMNLDKVSLKDNYPLPKMDHILQKFVGDERISTTDGFYGYNQINFLPEYRKKKNIHDTMGNLYVCQNAIWVNECRRKFLEGNGHRFS